MPGYEPDPKLKQKRPIWYAFPSPDGFVAQIILPKAKRSESQKLKAKAVRTRRKIKAKTIGARESFLVRVKADRAALRRNITTIIS